MTMYHEALYAGAVREGTEYAGGIWLVSVTIFSPEAFGLSLVGRYTSETSHVHSV